MKKIFSIFIILTLVGCFFTGCSNDTNNIDPTAATTGTEPTSYPFYKTEEDTYEITTPYAVLQYPSRWQDNVTVSQNNEPCLILSFSTEFASGSYPLFDFAFGEISEGDHIGNIKIDDSDIKIYVKYYDIDSNVISQDEYYTWCSMCEDINVIISGLVYNYNMTLI